MSLKGLSYLTFLWEARVFDLMLIYSLGHFRELLVSTLYSGKLQYGDALILNVDGLVMYVHFNFYFFTLFTIHCRLNLHYLLVIQVLEDVDPTKVKVNRNNLSRKPTEETLRLERLGDEVFLYTYALQLQIENSVI